MSIAFSVLLLGLDNAGKTCLIYPLKNNIYRDLCDIRPTAGFEMHTIQIDRMDKQILVYDCSGNGRHRSNWSIFYQETDAIIYVVDSCDAERLSIVKEQLNKILKDELIIFKNLPFVIMLNKQDKKEALDPDYIKELLELDNLKLNFKLSKIIVKESSGFTGLGVQDTLEWIANNLTKKR